MISLTDQEVAALADVVERMTGDVPATVESIVESRVRDARVKELIDAVAALRVLETTGDVTTPAQARAVLCGRAAFISDGLDATKETA